MKDKSKFKNTTLLIGALSFLVAILWFVKTREKEVTTLPEILFTVPGENENAVDTQISIKFVFKNKINENQQVFFSVASEPSFDCNLEWSESNVLKITPKEPLSPQTRYKVKLKFREKEFFVLSFTTREKPTTPSEKKEEENDIAFDEVFSSLYKEKPWLSALPLKSKNYVVVYDFQKKEIRARLIIDSLSPLSQEEQISLIKNEVLQKLRKIGVDTEKEKINWLLGLP